MFLKIELPRPGIAYSGHVQLMQASYSAGKKRQSRVYKLFLVFCIYMISEKKRCITTDVGKNIFGLLFFLRNKDNIKLKHGNNCRNVYCLRANPRTAGRSSIRSDSGQLYEQLLTRSSHTHTHQQMHYLLTWLKVLIYIKIHNNIAPTCFGFQLPSSGSFICT